MAVSRFLRSKPNNGTHFLSSIRSFGTISTSRTRSLSSPPTLPSKKTILPDGHDWKHWLVCLHIPKNYCFTRSDIIDICIRNLTSFVGSREEAKKRIYSVSTSYYNAYGALFTEELANKMRHKDTFGLIKKIIPDPFVYEGKKEYQGEPFIDGEAVDYDFKYHEAWVKINGPEEEFDTEDEAEEAEEEEERKREELYGVDYEHWLVWMRPPQSYLSRDEIIKNYIKTLAYIVGSEEEARKSIYKVSTRLHYVFGALLNSAYYAKLEREGYLHGVLRICPDCYEDIENKDYGGEPFINGEAVPYDPKYHEGFFLNRCPEFDWYLNSEKGQPNMQIRELENNVNACSSLR